VRCNSGRRYKFRPKAGYRLCEVCRIEDHGFTVREVDPLAVRLAEGRDWDAKVGCEVQGLICARAKRYYEGLWRVLLIFGGIPFVSLVYHEITKNGQTDPEVREQERYIKAMREDSAAAELDMRQWCNDTNAQRFAPMAAADSLSDEWTADYVGSLWSQRSSTYSLKFAASDEHDAENYAGTLLFHGYGKDGDRNFIVESGRLNPSTRRLAWCERSEDSRHFARCHMECTSEDCTRLEGNYLAAAEAYYLVGHERMHTLSMRKVDSVLV
jgi:hypothetical protein